MAGYTRTISPQQWAKEMKALWGSGAAAGFAEVAERGLTEAGMRAIGLLQQRSDELAHDVGHFKRAWRSDVDGLRLTLHNTMPYSGVIEDGRRPDSRPPPSAALVPWVKRKLDI